MAEVRVPLAEEFFYDERIVPNYPLGTMDEWRATVVKYGTYGGGLVINHLCLDREWEGEEGEVMDMGILFSARLSVIDSESHFQRGTVNGASSGRRRRRMWRWGRQ